ncbi:MAG: dethiobiotin synthase [Planctomycetales bacterium]|nr:dethiobiotin synthase [Planctomycetales bacterium]
MNRPKYGLFVTGTNTEVGKTYVASLIASTLSKNGVRVGVYKPVASGCTRRPDGTLVSEDAVELWNAAGRPLGLDAVCPQAFERPVAPHLAARADGRTSDFSKMIDGLSLWADFDLVIVEGAGGLMSPISDNHYTADLAAEFGYPVIVVAANRLGAINETLQTLICAKQYSKLSVAGVVLNDTHAGGNDESLSTNWHELSKRCEAPCLCHFSFNDIESATKLAASVDWLALSRRL